MMDICADPTTIHRYAVWIPCTSLSSVGQGVSTLLELCLASCFDLEGSLHHGVVSDLPVCVWLIPRKNAPHYGHQKKEK